MSGRNVQRKLGTTRGSPRRSRTAKASRISRRAVKSRCACEWDGWGRLSDDGPGQNNPDPSEGPWGRWNIPPHGGALSSPQARHRADHRSDHEMHEGRMQTGWRTANAGSRLKLLITQEGTVWKASLPAVLRENPPYGMIGGIEETSASFEARTAPRSYPTGSSLGLCLPASWHLYRAHSQRRKTSRTAGPAGNQIRTGRQPQDREGPRPHHPGNAVGHCR